MKKTILVLMSFVSTIATANQKIVTKSIYTDLKNDCIVVSSATDKAPIDFYTSECKAFGGYTLRETGSDLRYGPELSIHGKQIDLQKPYRFYSMGSQKIEWVYTLTQDEEGSGSINYDAFIFRLEVANEDPYQKDQSVLYVVRLKGEQSCVIGTVATNEEARKLAVNKSAPCITVNND